MNSMEEQQDIVLMHKDVEVAAFSIDPVTGYITSRIEVLDALHLPLPVRFAQKNDFAAVQAMKEWVEYRSIPASRNPIDVQEKYGVSSNMAASYKNLGLNLSDQYWFKPAGMDVSWKDVNLFDNYFPDHDFSANSLVSTFSPDYSTNGELPKFWRMKENRCILYKEGSDLFRQQPYNEVFAHLLLDELGLHHVEYTLHSVSNRTCSACATFVSGHTEYIPALDILNAVKKSNSDNSYMHFFRCAEDLEIPLKQRDIDNMLLFDFIINNTDRHYGNFGFIRDADTLEWKGLAPIFDNGNSLWYDQMDYDMVLINQPSKPFKKTWKVQVKLIKQSDCSINRLTPEFIEKAATDIFTGGLPEQRIRNIIRLVRRNVSKAENMLIFS